MGHGGCQGGGGTVRGTAEGVARQREVLVRGVSGKDPEKVEQAWKAGQMSEEVYERWKKRLAMDEGQLEAHLRDLYRGKATRAGILAR